MSMNLGASAPSTLGPCLRFGWFPRLFLVRVSYECLVSTNSCESVKDLFDSVVSETWNTHHTSLGLDGSYKKRLKTYCTHPQMM